MENKEPNWKEIATELAQRLSFAIANGKFGSGFMLDTNTMKSHSVKDYFADGLEMIPGVKVNRELMHMTPAQRRKFNSKKVSP